MVQLFDQLIRSKGFYVAGILSSNTLPGKIYSEIKKKKKINKLLDQQKFFSVYNDS